MLLLFQEVINTGEFQCNESILTKPAAIEMGCDIVLSALESHSENIIAHCI